MCMYVIEWVYRLLSLNPNHIIIIPIGKRLFQVSKNIKLTTYKGKQLKWRCHNDATIPKVELWFQLWHCYADFEVVYTFELMTQPSENCSGAENR